MAAPQGLTDLRLFLHSRQIDHAWLRTVLYSYLAENGQSDETLFEDHLVWEYRNTIVEFAQLLEEDPAELNEDED